MTSPLLAPLDDPQHYLISILFETYQKQHSWPNWQFVERTMDLAGIDPDHTISNLPQIGNRQMFYGISYGLTWKHGTCSTSYQLGDTIGLTAAGFHQAGGHEYMDVFLSVLEMACRKLRDFIPNPQKVLTLEISSDEILAHLSDGASESPILTAKELYALLEHEPAIWTGGLRMYPNDDWRWEITRDIQRYSNIKIINDYVEVVMRLAEESAQQVAQMSHFIRPSDELMVASGEPPFLSPQVPLLGSGIDSELWEYILSLVEAERWEQVAREAAAFVEIRAKEWTGSKKEILDLLFELLAPSKQQGTSGRKNAAEINEQEGLAPLGPRVHHGGTKPRYAQLGRS